MHVNRPDRPAPPADSGESPPPWLPDFCSLPVIFAAMVVSELLVLVILIAPTDESQPLLPRLATASAFVQWLALVCVVCLCQLRAPLLRMHPSLALGVAYALILTVVLLGSALVFQLDHQLSLGLTLPLPLQARFLGRNALLAALVGAALLRYFYVLEQWRSRVRAEAKARFEALQARIRPHFLFNSMNVIASLIPIRPRQAERAIEDLSDLFRAALGGDASTRGTLGEELELVRRYLDIEKLRLGERLHVELDIDDLPDDLPMPRLLLQPLVENAVKHGIAGLLEGGSIRLQARRSGNDVAITIQNAFDPEAPSRRSMGMGLQHVRRRLEVRFSGQAAFDAHAEGSVYLVSLRFPCESPIASSNRV